MTTIHWLFLAMLATVALVVTACAAQPAWTNPAPQYATNTLFWTHCGPRPDGKEFKPYEYVITTNDAVLAIVPMTVTTYQHIVVAPQLLRYNVAGTNTGGRGEASNDAWATNEVKQLPPKVGNARLQ